MCIDISNSLSYPQVLVGPTNWSNSAENRNDENTLIVHDANITNQYYQAFVYLYGQAGGVLSSNENEITKDNFVLYPNPTNGILHITAKENSLNDSVDLRVYDVLGKKVLEKHSTNLINESIDLSNQASGMYFVDVLNDGKEVWFKVVKD